MKHDWSRALKIVISRQETAPVVVEASWDEQYSLI
jgi:hypothetical protein